MNQLKLFTIPQANKLLPQLTQDILVLQKEREILSKLEVEIDAVELIADKDDGGSSPFLSKKVQEYSRRVNDFYGIIDAIHERGCFLKDLDLGLVDFYGTHKGHVVYLCWKLGEPEVGHWHEVGRGFNSRQPLDPHAGSHEDPH